MDVDPRGRTSPDREASKRAFGGFGQDPAERPSRESVAQRWAWKTGEVAHIIIERFASATGSAPNTWAGGSWRRWPWRWTGTIGSAAATGRTWRRSGSARSRTRTG